MRRLLFVPLALVGFACALAIGSGGVLALKSGTAKTTPGTYTYTAGTLTALGSSSLTVAGDGARLTCRIRPGAQSMAKFRVGEKVGMYCKSGVFYELIDR
jgi:hypothetical protein